MTSAWADGLVARLVERRVVAGRSLPPPILLVLAAIGAFLLLVVATTSWAAGTDEQAYWRAATHFAAGASMYDPTATPGDASFGYWYPPPLAQVLAPFTAFISADVFSVLWTALLLACLWWIGGRDVLVALALIAFLPVAVELRVRNVHLLLAVLVVLALRRSWAFWIPATAIKVAPILGVVYLASARRWREAVWVAALGLVVLLASVLLAPAAWQDFLALVVPQAGSSGASIVPIPFPVRLALGAALAVVAGQLALRGRARAGEITLVIALIAANPTLWVTALSLLVTIVPLWRTSGSQRMAGSQDMPGSQAIRA
jgi:hypothetical protein